LRTEAENTVSNINDHDRLRDLLIEIGVWESAVLDSIYNKEETITPVTAKSRDISTLAGRAFCYSWEKNTLSAGIMISKLRILLNSFPIHFLPDRVTASVPEGYAFYSLYPEHYYLSVRKIISDLKPSSAVVIGIRSIGTSLSAVAAGTLINDNVTAFSFTVRPIGHPFDRYVRLGGKLKHEISKRSGSIFLIVDEGPGLSGSSMISVATALKELGIPKERIIFVTAWIPSPKKFFSEKSRIEWPDFSNYSSSFEEVWLQNGNFMDLVHNSELEDLSAGEWRTKNYSVADFPAVNTTHERRKYHFAGSGGESFLLKFEGLGKHGIAIKEKAKRLSKAGFSQPVYGIANGFLMFGYIYGKQANALVKEIGLLDRMAEYLAWIKNESPIANPTPAEEIKEMVRVNTLEGLGESWSDRAAEVFEDWEGDDITGIDGRMFPHEWISSGGDYFKTDCLHHDCDHFFPGGMNSAWDIAGTCIEFRLKRDEKDHFINKYSCLTGDHTVVNRLPFYFTAYSAFRLGYSTLSAQSLDGSDDKRRFEELIPYYSSCLRSSIEKAWERV
jgi:hypothetical protein